MGRLSPAHSMTAQGLSRASVLSKVLSGASPGTCRCGLLMT